MRCHLIDCIPVCDLCDGCKLRPTLYYQWQKLVFENAAAALEPKKRWRNEFLWAQGLHLSTPRVKHLWESQSWPYLC